MVTGWVFRLAALAVIALHLVAGHLPEQAAWSVWPYTALPVGVDWLGAAVVASLALPPVNALVAGGYAGCGQRCPARNIPESGLRRLPWPRPSHSGSFALATCGGEMPGSSSRHYRT